VAAAAALLMSRRWSTRRMLGMVDWHLLMLFAGLFVVTAAFEKAGLAGAALAVLPPGLDPAAPASLAAISLAGSNSIGNVPLVMLLLKLMPQLSVEQFRLMALFTTLSGNFLLTGSIANIIAAEQAERLGVKLGFGDFAKVGIPATLAGLAAAWAWAALLW
jgi:Na+/H+ antiporter NhaD/arsenite permease-like protein